MSELRVNAFNFEWDATVLLYANHPWTLIGKVLAKAWKKGLYLFFVGYLRIQTGPVETSFASNDGEGRLVDEPFISR